MNLLNCEMIFPSIPFSWHPFLLPFSIYIDIWLRQHNQLRWNVITTDVSVGRREGMPLKNAYGTWEMLKNPASLEHSEV